MQAVIDAPTRMQLECMVKALTSQPLDKLVPAQHATAYKYLRTLAKEITEIKNAHVSFLDHFYPACTLSSSQWMLVPIQLSVLARWYMSLARR